MDALRTLDLSDNRVEVAPGLLRAGVEDTTATAAAEVDDLHEAPRDPRPLALNLRLNSLTGPVTLASIQNVTELDVSDNGITSLDVSCLSALTSLTCSNNALASITLHGAALTLLSAPNNRLTSLEVRYHPRKLTKLNLSRNELEAVPPWLVSGTEVTLVDISYNQITILPAFLTSGHLHRLHTLSAHHNCLTAFPVPQPDLTHCRGSCCCLYATHRTPRGSHRSCHHDNSCCTSSGLVEEPKCCSLEVLYLHCNKIPALPSNLFSWLNRLRVLNVSANQLSVLPGLVEGQDGRGAVHGYQDHGGSPKVALSLQELYAAANRLRDLSPLQYCRALRILHAPYNRITSLHDKLVWSWELMEELVLSANQLSSVPSGVSRLSRLRVLKVHSNPLQSLPRLAHLSALKVVDASRCHLGHLELEEVVSPGLVALDISGNTALSLDHHQFTKCKSRRPVNVVDVTSCSGRSLPLTKPPASVHHNHQGSEGHRGGNSKTTSPNLPWSLGFSEAIGKDSKLTVGQLRVPDLGGLGNVGVVAVADGGQEMCSVGTLLSALPPLLQEELACSTNHTYALKYALLTTLRRLRGQGAALPSAVCAAHLETSPNMPAQWPVLRLCCYGPVSATVTTTHGQPIVLTTSALRTPLSSVQECGDGVRCSLAEPPILPDPHTTELHLGPHHSAVIIASASLWEVIEPREAADICGRVSEPGSAAKQLLDLAQAYGTRQAVSVIVVQLKQPGNIFQNSPPGVHEGSAIPNMLHKHCNELETYEEYSDRDQHIMKDMTGTSRRVKFGKVVSPLQDSESHCFESDYIDSKENFVHSGVNKIQIRNEDKHVQTMVELERSSPSGQSQSDYSEYGPENNKDTRTKSKEFRSGKSKEIYQFSNEDIYAYPNRKKKEDVKKMEESSHIISYNNGKEKRKVTYYHYPRPESGIVSSQGHLTKHLLCVSQNEPQTSVLAPPAGFGDPGSDSEGSDSGLSGVSGVQNYTDHQSRDGGSEQVTEEQYRSWEYLLARNAKLLYMRELDNFKKPASSSSIKPTVSAPDLVLATAAETETSGHFQRNNNVRKSRLGRGTFRLIQNKLNATASKFNTFQKMKVTGSSISNFRRFGSLQNLKYYQQNRSRAAQYPAVQQDISAEMQERPSLDSLELETRMHHYWHTGITNF